MPELKELISESMTWERAIGHIDAFDREIRTRAREAADQAEVLNEQPDGAYQAVIDALDGVREQMRIKADDLWAEAKDHAVFTRESAEALCNAVMLQAAQDYERAICTNDLVTQESIEKFAERDAALYSEVDFTKVLARIRDTHPLFVMMAHDQMEEIVAETLDMRKRGETIHNDLTHKCPLCGNGLYAYGTIRDRIVTIRCSGCAFIEYMNPEREGKKGWLERLQNKALR